MSVRKHLRFPEGALEVLQNAADRHCGGNLSQYLIEAGMMRAEGRVDVLTALDIIRAELGA